MPGEWGHGGERPAAGSGLGRLVFGALAGAIALGIGAAALAFGLLVFVFVVPLALAAIGAFALFAKHRTSYSFSYSVHARDGTVVVEDRRSGAPPRRISVRARDGDEVVLRKTVTLDADGAPIAVRYRVTFGDTELLDSADEGEARRLAGLVARALGRPIREGADPDQLRIGRR